MRNEALQLAEEIARNGGTEAEIKQKAERLIELIPSLTVSEIDTLIARLESCARGKLSWKKELAGHIVETALVQHPIPHNPLSIGIKHVYEQLSGLRFTNVAFFSSIIQAIILTPMLILFAIIWPYGLIPVAAGTVWKVILVSRAKMKFKTHHVMEKMPLTLAIGVYLLWLPFVLLCLPFVIIGWIGDCIE